MPLTLQNFDKTEDEDTTARGLKYFKDGAVSTLEETEEGEWEASVMGTDLYSVGINLRKKKIEATGCDCPAFASDNYCKHVAAVLFAIRDKLAKTDKPIKIRKAKIKTPIQILHDIVDEAEAKYLKEFIKTYAARNKGFTDDALLHFRLLSVLHEATEEGFKDLVKYAADSSVIKADINSDLLSKHLSPIMAQAQAYVGDNNFLEGFYIIKAIMEVIGPVFYGLGYNFRYYANAVTESIELLERIASFDIPPMFRDDLFDYCLALSGQEWLATVDYDRRIDKLLPLLANDNGRRQQILALIDGKLKRLLPKGTRSINTSILKKHLTYLQDEIELLRQLQRYDEAEKLIVSNMYYHDEFRHLEIAKAIENGNPEYARLLIKEKIAGNCVKVEGAWYNQEKEQENWVPYFIDIAILENNIPDILLYAELLFKSTQDIKYYNILKKFYAADKWQKKYVEIELSLFRKHYSFGILASIYVGEGKIKDLFELLKNMPISIISTILFLYFCLHMALKRSPCIIRPLSRYCKIVPCQTIKKPVSTCNTLSPSGRGKPCKTGSKHSNLSTPTGHAC
jgi:hypothetical protein